jgi:SAM-dependent methyltransferase
MLEQLLPVRDKVLDRSGLVAGETLLDVGCGEGMIGFGALERGAAHVVFSDISDDLLAFCARVAGELDVTERCSFVKAGAADLAEVTDESVDVVTTRSVLIYVPEKDASFHEFFRVLRPGGRFSCFEPINRFGMEDRRRDLWGYPGNGVSDLTERVADIYFELQPPSDPMVDFDERDLMRAAEAAGFFPIDLDLHAEIRSMDPKPWEVFLHSSGNPKIPTFAEAMDQVLTPDERDRLTEHLRPLVEEGRGVWRMASAYMRAVKP